MSLKKKKDLKQLLKLSQDNKLSKINPEQKLSLCLIVKNEEKNIERCIKSVENIVDEIVILDTGSTDNTLEIAKKYNTRIFHSEWKNDFALARNEAISHATGDWILILDADEELIEGSNDSIRIFMIPTEDPICYTIRIKNYNERKELQHSNFMTRFFKNHPTLRFKGKIHESIYTENRVMIADDNLYILHHGYKDASKNVEKFKERNNPIIEELFNQEGVNDEYKSFLGFYLGSDKIAFKDYDGAIKEFEDAVSRANIENESQHEFHLHLYLQLAFTYILNSNFDKARKFLLEASEKLPKILNTYEYWTDLGHLDFIEDKFDDSVKNFQKAIEIFENKELNYFRVVNDPFYYYFSLNGLVQCYKKLNLLSKAIEIVDKSYSLLKGKSSNVSDYITFSYLYVSCEDYQKALDTLVIAESLETEEEQKYKILKYMSNLYLKLNKFYESIITQAKIHDPQKVKDNWYAIAQSLEDEKHFDFAEDVYSAIIFVIPDDSQAYLGRAVSRLTKNKTIEALEDIATAKKYAISFEDRVKIALLYMQIGQLYQARVIIEELIKESPEHYELNLYKASLEQSEGKYDSSKQTLLGLISLYPEDQRAYVQIANLMLSIQENDNAIKMYDKAKTLDSTNAYVPYALSICYLNKGDKEKATSYLDEAISIEPDNQNLIEMKEKVLSLK